MDPDPMLKSEIKPAVPAKRYGFWCLERRVPKRFRAVDSRNLVPVSAGIRIVDDTRGVAAKSAVAALDADLLSLWQQRPGAACNRRAYERAVRVATDHGVTYMPAKDIIALSVDDLVRRFELLIDNKLGGLTGDKKQRTAVMGGMAIPELMVSAMVDEFQTVHDVIHESKSPNQKKKWRATAHWRRFSRSSAATGPSRS
jgi:hypothetical protein